LFIEWFNSFLSLSKAAKLSISIPLDIILWSNKIWREHGKGRKALSFIQNGAMERVFGNRYEISLFHLPDFFTYLLDRSLSFDEMVQFCLP